MTPQEILNLPMRENDAKAKTIRDYLLSLLYTVWDKGEGFSGKRPFGNSGWEWELHWALSDAGLIDEDDDINGHRLICEAIGGLGHG